MRLEAISNTFQRNEKNSKKFFVIVAISRKLHRIDAFKFEFASTKEFQTSEENPKDLKGIQRNSLKLKRMKKIQKN